MVQVQQNETAIQTGGQVQDFVLPAGTNVGQGSTGSVVAGAPQKAPAAQPSQTIQASSNVTFECPPSTDAYVFCKKKIPNSSELTGIDLKVDDYKTCQRKCWEHGDSCQSWSFSKDGNCAFGTSRDTGTFESNEDWISGPRHDPNSTGSGSYEDEAETEEPTETAAPEKTPLWKNPIVIGGSVAVMMIMMLVIAMVAAAS